MPTLKLTPQAIRQTVIAPGQRKVQLFDTETPGLVLELRASQRGTFYLRYTAAGKTRYVKLGLLNALTLADARRAAQHEVGRLALGQPPVTPVPAPVIPTLATFVQDRYLPFVKSYKRSWSTDESILRNYVLPALGALALDRITRDDVLRLIQHHRQTHLPSSSNRVLILCRYLFNLGLKWEIPGVTANPSKGIPRFQENNRRERYLSPDETQRLFKTLKDSLNPSLRDIVPMLLLTGARKNEVLQARWEDLDLERRSWRIPHPKSGEARHVPLSDALLALLASLPSRTDGVWLFPNPRTGKPFLSIYHSWDTARQAAGLPEVRIHDLRHSFASYLVNCGHSLYEVQTLLGHTQIKTTQRYAHLSQETLRAATNAVGQLLGSG
jgi:integrase